MKFAGAKAEAEVDLNGDRDLPSSTTATDLDIAPNLNSSASRTSKGKPRNMGEAENAPYMEKASSYNTDISLESLEGTSYLLKEKTSSVRPVGELDASMIDINLAAGGESTTGGAAPSEAVQVAQAAALNCEDGDSAKLTPPAGFAMGWAGIASAKLESTSSEDSKNEEAEAEVLDTNNKLKLERCAMSAASGDLQLDSSISALVRSSSSSATLGSTTASSSSNLNTTAQAALAGSTVPKAKPNLLFAGKNSRAAGVSALDELKKQAEEEQ
jgi:hypothetical protein